jgi:hypothetical protein
MIDGHLQIGGTWRELPMVLIDRVCLVQNHSLCSNPKCECDCHKEVYKI